tara:strand:+ start:505 stop:879 length:375 start_codon:yes stop_codon:yes gene_type:complete
LEKLTKISLYLIVCIICCGKLILGASFDCNIAKTIRKKTICNDTQLSKLDREIGVIFQKFNKKKEGYKEIVKRKNTWTSETKYFTKNSFELHRYFLKFMTSFSSCLERNVPFKECYHKITKIDL